VKGWEAAQVVLAGVGLADSVYLLSDIFFPTVRYVCPAGGLINCESVTGSQYSQIFGIPVALLAAGWFSLFLLFGIFRPSFAPTVSLPLWLCGAVFAGYLIGTELFVLHAICPFCTLAHAVGLLIGAPVLKAAMTEL
jgi:uncharacterized membrane protein